jgi:hypothetical protein
MAKFSSQPFIVCKVQQISFYSDRLKEYSITKFSKVPIEKPYKLKPLEEWNAEAADARKRKR